MSKFSSPFMAKSPLNKEKIREEERQRQLKEEEEKGKDRRI